MPKKKEGDMMNIEKYTQNAQSIMMDCQNMGLELGHQQLDVLHLHLALIKQHQGLIPKLLKNMEVNVEELIAEISAELDKLPKVSGGVEHKK